MAMSCTGAYHSMGFSVASATSTLPPLTWNYSDGTIIIDRLRVFRKLGLKTRHRMTYKGSLCVTVLGPLTKEQETEIIKAGYKRGCNGRK